MGRILRSLFVVLVVASTAAGQQKKRVAVMDFDYGTVRSDVAAIFGSDQDVGKGISDLLVQKLVQDGKYSVIERNALDKVLQEQNFSNSDRADPSTAAKIGRVLGVDAIIIGSITEFGRENKHLGVGGNAYGLGKFGLGGIGKKQGKATVAVSARMVDTSTGEILAAETGTGTSERSGLLLGGEGGGGGGGGGGNFDMGSSNFGATILGEATHKAVDDLGAQLDTKADALPSHKVEYSGMVADVEGNTLILDVGRNKGAKVGDQVAVSRKIKDIKDPSTGAVIKTLTSDLGTATITEVDALSSTATFNGSNPPKVGDIVKSQ